MVMPYPSFRVVYLCLNKGMTEMNQKEMEFSLIRQFPSFYQIGTRGQTIDRQYCYAIGSLLVHHINTQQLPSHEVTTNFGPPN
jgi:hypothetical protein